MAGGAAWRIYSYLWFWLSTLAAFFFLTIMVCFSFIACLFCLFVKYHPRAPFGFEVKIFSLLSLPFIFRIQRCHRFTSHSYVRFGRCQVASFPLPITSHRWVQVWDCCWVEPVLAIVLTSVELYHHSSWVPVFIWLLICMDSLVVSRNVGCDTLLVTWNRKFSMIYFDGDLNVCLSVSDEWFVFKVWQRKMISCCSAVFHIHCMYF